MSTKSNRSSGTQHNQRGVTQGNTLVGPQSGLPIDEVVDGDGVRRLAVDANVSIDSATINADIDYLSGDSTAIGDPNTSTILKINPDGSIDTNVNISASSGDNISISDGTNDLLINPDGSINVNINPLTTPLIANQVVTLANTEYSYTFPANTKKFSLRTRGNARLQVAFVATQSGSNFITVYPGNTYEEIGLKITGITAYFQSNKAGETVEILSWT
jgi:hypothetical protein